MKVIIVIMKTFLAKNGKKEREQGLCPLIFKLPGNASYVLVLVLVKSRQRAVLMTPVCPVSYGNHVSF